MNASSHFFLSMTYYYMYIVSAVHSGLRMASPWLGSLGPSYDALYWGDDTPDPPLPTHGALRSGLRLGSQGRGES
jgi:hypothetical protein